MDRRIEIKSLAFGAGALLGQNDVTGVIRRDIDRPVVIPGDHFAADVNIVESPFHIVREDEAPGLQRRRHFPDGGRRPVKTARLSLSSANGVLIMLHLSFCRRLYGRCRQNISTGAEVEITIKERTMEMPKFLNHLPALLLAAFLAMMGVQKFGAENIIFATIAERSGVDLFEPVIRMITGAGEVAAALLLLLPKTRRLGALGAIAIIGGAIIFHLSPWLGVSVAMAPGEEPTPMLFIMALGSFLLAIVTFILARGSAGKPNPVQ